ncbi:UDP-glycosyltransferase 71K1-like [Eucalyptus grandis]|uniref:UDP-glycosyltransferase 71K1-like n=1 Tax=Eucalyptus grandis TaxID=71139 RepID=UPI00192EE737|nr:UDP-glycosyltransferase 71K1-like [Eucalyptus grandis]
MESYVPHVQRAAGEIQSSQSASGLDRSVAGFVLDFFCMSMINVADGLSLPSYIYLTSNTHSLGLMLPLLARHDQVGREVRPSDPASSKFHQPSSGLCLAVGSAQREASGYAAYIKQARRFRDIQGIMVNTFMKLEQFGVSSFSRGSLDRPAVYAVGPVIEPNGVPNPSLDRAHWEKVQEWFDEPPLSSMVFLRFYRKVDSRLHKEH